MIRTIAAFIFALLMTVAGYAAERPNFIFIMADDLGWKDVGFMGAAFFETPNIDRFASQGMTFTAAYSGGPNCAPTRACLMSGQHSSRITRDDSEGCNTTSRIMANQLNLMKCGPALLLIALACSADTVSAEEPHEGLYLKNLTYKGSITGDEITYTLYLPPEYSEEKGPYPIAFFLHGAGGGNASAEVLRSYEAARKSGHIGDCIIVFPEKYGGTVWRDGARDRMPETNVLKELLPFLEDKYSISKDRRHRTVMGFSMGAAGAIFWGAKYSDLFSVLVALDSGGGTSIDDVDARNYVPQYAEKQDALRQGALRIRIVQGALNTKGFRATLDRMKIPYEYAQLSKNIDDYPKGSHCLNRRDPTRKMLHNPACLTEGAWGRDTWAFIGKNMGKGAKPQQCQFQVLPSTGRSPGE